MYCKIHDILPVLKLDFIEPACRLLYYFDKLLRLNAIDHANFTIYLSNDESFESNDEFLNKSYNSSDLSLNY